MNVKLGVFDSRVEANGGPKADAHIKIRRASFLHAAKTRARCSVR